MATILVDDRERAVIDALRAASDAASVSWRAQRLTHGDYALVQDAQTLAIIERKTYSDFAQSIKDERMNNMQRLVELRRASGETMRLAILLEGPRLDDDDKVAGIPIKCIRAKIDHMWLRDDIHLVETRDVAATARYLLALARNASSLARATGSALSQVEGRGGAERQLSRPSAASATIATQRIAPPAIREQVIAMFKMFPGVGPKTAAAIVDCGISIEQFTRNPSPEDDQAESWAPKIARLAARYRAERTPDLDADIIAAQIGATKPFAAALLASSTIADLCARTRDDLCAFIWRDKKRATLCGRIYDSIHYRATEDIHPQ